MSAPDEIAAAHTSTTDGMLYRPERHEPCETTAWNPARAQALIERIVADTEAQFSPEAFWPMHPLDADGRSAAPAYPLYFGAAGVIWALRYLKAIGAAAPQRSHTQQLSGVLERDREWLAAVGVHEPASYLMGETSILMSMYWDDPSAETAARIEQLIAANLGNPSRELMWGSPGTMLAALFMHERTGEPRWAAAFRSAARLLQSQLSFSKEHDCRYWTQELYGTRSSYVDAVHGFVGNAAPLLRGLALLDDAERAEWTQCIANTVRRAATVEDGLVNWQPWLIPTRGSRGGWLMQFCHGAPGFVVCLAAFPGGELDDLLLGAGEAIWRAGPLRKGSNLCHGTGGNGYAFLKLHARTRDSKWLERARAFAMHGIRQTERDAARFGQMRYSLWTGDLGFAIYLKDCLDATAAFPTLDAFFAD